MSRRLGGWLIVVLVAMAAAAAFLVHWRERGRDRPTGPTAPLTTQATSPADPTDIESFDLYFPGAGGLLYRERRELATGALARSRAEAVVTALLAGPQGEGLVAPFPAGVTLAGVILAADGTAYVDLASLDGAPPPASGSQRELQTVYSLVETVTRNVPEARRVALLWNDVQPDTLSGHLDLTRAFVGDGALVARTP
jgi:hypothetical protein